MSVMTLAEFEDNPFRTMVEGDIVMVVVNDYEAKKSWYEERRVQRRPDGSLELVEL